MTFHRFWSNLWRKSLRKKSEIKIICGDFFEHNGSYDFIVEQTFFCALHPSLRSDYAKKMYELLADDGILVGVLFNVTFAENPPFGGNKNEYHELFEQKFKIL